MIKKFFIFIIGGVSIAYGQKFSIANERMNIFYAGVDNPVAISVDNTSLSSIVVKATIGTIRKDYGSYIYHADSAGATQIIIYKRTNNNLTEIGRQHFRIKLIPPPIFKIGSGKKRLKIAEVAAQEFVRAELENFDIDIRFTIKRFNVIIVSSDTCSFKKITNVGNKIGDELKEAFRNLKENDTILFKDIFIQSLYGVKPDETELENVFVTIYK